MNFWNTFVKLCNNVGKAPNVVAKELEISSGSVTAWKQDPARTPQARILYKIADYFGVSVSYLLGNEEKEKALNEDNLTESQKVLLELFNQVPEKQQELVLQMIKAALNNL